MFLFEDKLSNKDFWTFVSYIAAFCTVDGEFTPFWYNLQDQFIQSYTIKEVFDMESSVRVEAIENLGMYPPSG